MAQRPQLVPRAEANVASAEASDDPDAAAVQARGPQRDVPLPFDEDADTDANIALIDEEPYQPSRPRNAQVTAQLRALPIALRPITYGDCDRLWDWVRDDVTGATKFLGAVPEHSRALHNAIDDILARQEQGTALLHAVDVDSGTGPMHVGFLLLAPINRTAVPAIALTQCYLAPGVQQTLPQVLPALLDLAADLEPALTFMVTTDNYAFAQLLQPRGFLLQIALTRPPANTRK